MDADRLARALPSPKNVTPVTVEKTMKIATQAQEENPVPIPG